MATSYADPTGVRSSRGALAALLKELKLSGRSDAGANLANANARAVIYFPEGRFVLHNDDDNVVDPTSANQKYTDSKGNNRSEEIFIRGGYFVLKGAGRGKTTLVMVVMIGVYMHEVWDYDAPPTFTLKDTKPLDFYLDDVSLKTVDPSEE